MELANVDSLLMAFSKRLLRGAAAGRVADLVVTLELIPILIESVSVLILRCVSLSAASTPNTSPEAPRVVALGSRRSGCDDAAIASAKGASPESPAMG